MEDTLARVRVQAGEPGPVKAIAQLKDGRTVSQECRHFQGSAARPMTRDQRTAKFQHCASRVLPARDVSELLEVLESLEELPSIGPLMDLLGRTGTASS